ncbi:MAG: gliding motility-associated C-terminal domain-containing protein, partial [Bacteroidota bacterium]
SIPAATDICDNTNVNVVCDFAPGDFFDVGTTLVTCTASDQDGNTAECIFTVTVEDQVVPQIDCPGDVVVNLDGTVVSGEDIIVSMVPNASCDSVQLFLTEPLGTDNCPQVVTNQTLGPVNNTFLPIGQAIDYKYVVTDDAGLQDSCEFSITINPLPSVSIIASTTTFCAGENVQLRVDSLAGASYTWIIPNGGGASGTVLDLTGANMEQAGTYTVICDLNGCTSSDEINLSIGEAPTLNAFSVNPICNDDLDLMVSIDPLSAPIDSFRWTGPNNFTATIAQPTVPNAISGDYILMAYNGTCITIDTVNVDFTMINTPELFSDCNETICLGESCTLLGTLYENPLIQYNWDSPDSCIVAQTGDNMLEITPSSAGECVIRYWASFNDCSSDTATITILIIEDPIADDDIIAISPETTSIDFNVLSNDNIDPNSNFAISVITDVNNGTLTNNDGGNFTYQPGSGFSTLDQFIYEVCYTCQGSLLCDNAVVSIESRDTSCTVPTVITPNGDARNDDLIIGCLEDGDHPNSEMIIYNQWGDEIFRRSPYGNGVYWDGTYNGSPVPDGTYFYVFRLDNNGTVDRGAITVFR